TVHRSYLDLSFELNDRWDLFGLVTHEDSQRDTYFGALGVGDAPDDTTTAELRAAFDFGDVYGWVGAYWFETEGTFQSVFQFPLALFGLPPVPPNSIAIFDTFQEDSTENRALFADVTWDINEAWSLSAGIRYDEEEFSDTGSTGETTVIPPDCVIDPSFPGFGGLPCSLAFPPTQDEPTSAEFDAWLPRASVLYRFDELRTLSFTYARGYRAGGSYIRAVPGEPVQLLDFDPEYLDNYELAWRSEWLDQSLIVNANLFFSDWQDQQVTVPGPTGFVFDSLTLNAGQSEIYGLEVEAQWVITDTLAAFATLGLVQTEFKDFPFAIDENGDPVNPDDPTYANLAGNEFNSAPQTTFSIGLSWDQGGGWFASGNLSYASSQFSDVTNLAGNKVGYYTLVNARGGYRWTNWSLAAFVDNLFDERFAMRQTLSSVSTASGSEALTPQPFFAVNNPRVFGVELRYAY
ncbi:MAG: TonB-dependent receptor, partial [Pseudomonadota bacterium]